MIEKQSEILGTVLLSSIQRFDCIMERVYSSKRQRENRSKTLIEKLRKFWFFESSGTMKYKKTWILPFFILNFVRFKRNIKTLHKSISKSRALALTPSPTNLSVTKPFLLRCLTALKLPLKLIFFSQIPSKNWKTTSKCLIKKILW